MAGSAKRTPRRRLWRSAIRAERFLPRRLHWWLARRVYADVAAGTCVLLFDESLHLLLVCSTYGPGWSTPGGFITRGEPAAGAAARELVEELGLAMGPPQLVELGGALRADRPVVDVIFCGRLSSGTDLRLDWVEIGSAEWFSLEDGAPPGCDPEVPAALAVLLRLLGADALHAVFSPDETERLRRMLTPVAPVGRQASG